MDETEDDDTTARPADEAARVVAKRIAQLEKAERNPIWKIKP